VHQAGPRVDHPAKLRKSLVKVDQRQHGDREDAAVRVALVSGLDVAGEAVIRLVVVLVSVDQLVVRHRGDPIARIMLRK
jgi:hypothetical protein